MLIIAEIACAHNGYFSKVKKLIREAYSSGANAVQFQIWNLNFMMSPKNKLFKKLKKIEFSENQWINLISYTRRKYPKLKIFCCFYEHKSFALAKKVKIDGIKINSSDLTNPLVLKEALKFKNIINLSIGGSSIAEINYAINLLKKKKNKINIMYGIQNFPTQIDEVNLIRLNHLKKIFKLPIGYQDHTSYKSPYKNHLCFMSIAMGVEIIEKHICYTRKKGSYDYESALLSFEFKKFIKEIQKFKKSLGKPLSKTFSKLERKYRDFQKKSIVLTISKQKNEIIEKKDISFLRTNKLGISPHKITKVLGRKLNKHISSFEPIKFSDLK